MSRRAPATLMALMPEAPAAPGPLGVGIDMEPPLAAANHCDATLSAVSHEPPWGARRLMTHLGAATLGAATSSLIFAFPAWLQTEVAQAPVAAVTSALAPPQAAPASVSLAVEPSLTTPPSPVLATVPPGAAPSGLSASGTSVSLTTTRAAHRIADAPARAAIGNRHGGAFPAAGNTARNLEARVPPAAAAHAAATGMDSLRISAASRTVDPALLHAYDAFHADDLAAAEAAYAALLAVEPHHADALQGMAALAIRRGHFERAQTYYRQALAANPANALAQAALLGLDRNTNALAAESRLKSLLAAQPHQHPVNFALGNVYAAGARWHEAQQQFFQAHTGDVQQPDYLFNLAVSLDHLQQPKLAADYYRLALNAAARRPAAFDQTLTAARLRELLP